MCQVVGSMMAVDSFVRESSVVYKPYASDRICGTDITSGEANSISDEWDI